MRNTDFDRIISSIKGQAPFYKTKHGGYNHYYGLVFNFSYEAAKIIRKKTSCRYPSIIDAYFS